MISIQLGTYGIPLEIGPFLNQDGKIVNLADYATLTAILTPQGGAPLTRAATLLTDGSDGFLTYTLTAQDFATPGWWRVQGHYTGPQGSLPSVPVRVWVGAP